MLSKKLDMKNIYVTIINNKVQRKMLYGFYVMKYITCNDCENRNETSVLDTYERLVYEDKAK